MPNRGIFAQSVLDSLDMIDNLKAQGKVLNGPITGITADFLAKFGLSGDSQEARDLLQFAQSAATGAHVGGRFNVPIMQKMDKMLAMNMNDEQFASAEQGVRDVMAHYAESKGRKTVGEYKAEIRENTPAGYVAVQIPGKEVAFIPQANKPKFKDKYPEAIIIQ